jgi:hypothetical protein
VNKIRFAVVSTDGINVNDHFGRAERFLIFDMDEQLKLVDVRTAEPLSSGDLKHPFDQDKFDRLVMLLKDCSRIYVTCIGDTPAVKLKELGIEPVIYSGAITHIKR